MSLMWLNKLLYGTGTVLVTYFISVYIQEFVWTNPYSSHNVKQSRNVEFCEFVCAVTQFVFNDKQHKFQTFKISFVICALCCFI